MTQISAQSKRERFSAANTIGKNIPTGSDLAAAEADNGKLTPEQFDSLTASDTLLVKIHDDANTSDEVADAIEDVLEVILAATRDDSAAGADLFGPFDNNFQGETPAQEDAKLVRLEAALKTATGIPYIHYEAEARFYRARAASRLRRPETGMEAEERIAALHAGAKPAPGSPDDIARRFAPYNPRPGVLQHVEKVRAQATMLAQFVALSNPDPRMMALFLTNLEQAVFWANKAITSNNEVSA